MKVSSFSLSLSLSLSLRSFFHASEKGQLKRHPRHQYRVKKTVRTELFFNYFCIPGKVSEQPGMAVGVQTALSFSARE